MPQSLTGSRIRERRVMAGLKQADLAQQIGISASYLNLIEHNRRRIGGKLLLNIAERLGVEPHALTEGAEAALIAALREAAEDSGLIGPDLGRAEEFAGRFPGWADVLVRTQRRIGSLEQTIETLSDRLAHDPHLAASMHELLSTAAAIRSTASILAEDKELQPEWRDRFHANIHQDSRRLSNSAQGLLAYLDSSENLRDAASSPQEEVEAFLQAHNYSFEQLDRTESQEQVATNLVDNAPQLQSLAARHIAQGVLRQVSLDASLLPMAAMKQAIAEFGLDPIALAGRLGCSAALVMRRMAGVPELGAGIVVCDGSGTVIFRKSIEGFNVPRFGACCPLWPLFSALGHSGLVVSEKVTQLSRSQVVFDCFAASETMDATQYNTPPLRRAQMLILPAEQGAVTKLTEVGATCRICSKQDCPARREPSIVAQGV